MMLVLYHSLSGLIGAVVSLAILALRVLPNKVDRTDVQLMLDNHPLNFRMKLVEELAIQDRAELRGIREGITGLREDFARQAALLEGLLRDRN